MIGLFASLFPLMEPVLSEAHVVDAPAIAALHGRSFARGWSEQEVETLIADRQVVTHRAVRGTRLSGFIMARMAADEAEILSIAVARAQQGRGLGRKLLDLSLRRLAGLGCRTVFLEVDENNAAAVTLYRRAGFRDVARRPNYYPGPNGKPAAALVLRRDLAG